MTRGVVDVLVGMLAGAVGAVLIVAVVLRHYGWV